MPSSPPGGRDRSWGLERFLVSNLTREQSVPVTSLYLGTVYRFALPWHNTMVLTAITTPVLIVALGLVGIATTLARARTARDDVIWPLSWSILMIVRALPERAGPRRRAAAVAEPRQPVGPGRDRRGLAGRSDAVRGGWSWSRRSSPAWPSASASWGSRRPIRTTSLITTSPSAGLPGAERLGFEETYYWDTLGPEFSPGCDSDRKTGRWSFSFPLGLLNIMILRDWGDFPGGVQGREAGPDDASRLRPPAQPGHLRPLDWWLERNGHPIFAIRRQGVDLLRVYPVRGSRGRPPRRPAASRASSSRPGGRPGDYPDRPAPGLLAAVSMPDRTSRRTAHRPSNPRRAGWMKPGDRRNRWFLREANGSSGKAVGP